MATPEEKPLSIPIPRELFDYIDDRISQAVAKAMSGTPVEPSKPVYYTRREVCDLLKISLPTVDRYIKIGLIKAQRVGTRIVVNSVNLEAALTQINLRGSQTGASGSFRATGRYKTPDEGQSSARRKIPLK